MAQENVEIARNATEAFNRRDKDAWLPLNDPEVEFRAPAEWPESGTSAGHHEHGAGAAHVDAHHDHAPQADGHSHDHDRDPPDGHEGTEGVTLSTSTAETVTPGPGCRQADDRAERRGVREVLGDRVAGYRIPRRRRRGGRALIASCLAGVQG